MGILLSWSNLAEGSAANLAVSSEAAGLGLRAVLTPQISDIWRSTAWGATTINRTPPRTPLWWLADGEAW